MELVMGFIDDLLIQDFLSVVVLGRLLLTVVVDQGNSAVKATCTCIFSGKLYNMASNQLKYMMVICNEYSSYGMKAFKNNA